MQQAPYQFKDEDIRLIDVIDSFKNYGGYLLRKFYIVIIGVGGLTYLGYLFAVESPPTYVANAAFNAIDPKGAGGLMSLANSLGFGIGGSSTNDVLMGIFSSRSVFKNSLMEEVEIDGKKDKLANFYMSTFGYDAGIRELPGYENFKFTSPNINSMNRVEDSISSVMYFDFVDSYLTIEFDIPSGLIKAEIETPTYELSKLLGISMMRNTIQFYQTKQVESAKISYDNVALRLDSIQREIDVREKMLASSKDINIFNKKELATIDQDKIERELASLVYMYSDALNSKESAKSTMTGQNSTIRVVDDPRFSTDVSPRSKLLWSIIGFAAGIVLVIIPMILHKAVSDARREEAKLAAGVSV
jgi:hypothetical protein